MDPLHPSNQTGVEASTTAALWSVLLDTLLSSLPPPPPNGWPNMDFSWPEPITVHKGLNPEATDPPQLLWSQCPPNAKKAAGSPFLLTVYYFLTGFRFHS
jgi:hypothetical protein